VGQASRAHSPAPVVTQRLLQSIAEQLKVPFLQISQQAELAATQQATPSLQTIRDTASSALTLIDNYLLSVRLAQQGILPNMDEPVTVSSVLYDVGTQLSPFAKAYDVKLNIQLGGKFGPVMTNRAALQAALTSLGYAFIEALPATDKPQLTLQLSAHRCRYGIVAGLYCDADHLSAKVLREGRELYGRVRQPLTTISPSAGAGVFVADSILQSLKSPLVSSRHRHLHGLGTILQANPQLQLI
jgi:hypothetical protein